MQISWHGQYTVKVVSKEITLILDPYSPTTGLSPFRAKGDIVALTNPTDESMSQVSGVQGEPILVDTAGEYSIKGFTLNCLGWMPEGGTERNVQRWVIEDMVVLHLGALNRAFEAKELQELERTDVDVLIVPVGGGSGLTTKEALQMVATLEPRVVIPIHYKLPGVKEELEDITTFATEMGIDPKITEKKIILKRGKLPQEDVLTVILVP
jgi:L-ascorbate metabolism protein UlaG (beta-lactamase superfamily)